MPQQAWTHPPQTYPVWWQTTITLSIYIPLDKSEKIRRWLTNWSLTAVPQDSACRTARRPSWRSRQSRGRRTCATERRPVCSTVPEQGYPQRTTYTEKTCVWRGEGEECLRIHSQGRSTTVITIKQRLKFTPDRGWVGAGWLAPQISENSSNGKPFFKGAPPTYTTIRSWYGVCFCDPSRAG